MDLTAKIVLHFLFIIVEGERFELRISPLETLRDVN